jgi:hypothetical protein
MNKVKQYGMLCVALVAFYSGGTSAGCPHLDNCYKCSDGVHCDECIDGGYGLRADRKGCGDCFEVSGGTCYKCTTLGRCDECYTTQLGWVMPTTKAMCADCAPHCQFCEHRGAGKCDDISCDPGYAANTDETCSPCAPGCNACSNSGPGGCDACNMGKGLRNGKGSPPADCEACTTPNCEFCASDHTICDYCKTGFQLNSSGQCIACTTPNCEFCTSDHTICVYCKTGFELNSSGQCIG